MHSNILILIWRRKLSLLICTSTIILIALWSWALYNTSTYSTVTTDKLIDYNSKTKHEYFLQRLISQANQILRIQRQHENSDSEFILSSSSSLSISKAIAAGRHKKPPIMENNPFDEERLKILQNQQQKGQNDNQMDYERILSSTERQTQYEHELRKIGVPIIPGIGPGGPRAPHERLVHLDLKGAPPKISFLKKLVPLMKSLGATGILIEYEDMFPYTGNLQTLAAKNAFNAEDLRDFLDVVVHNGLSVMPLVQTFGHLEYALKLQGFDHMREIPESPQSICPSQKMSMSFLQDMITQIIEFHLPLNSNSSIVSGNDIGGPPPPRRRRSTVENFKYIHIGCDEVYRMGECEECRKKPKSRHELFLSHVTSIASFIREKWPQLKPIIWDDMLRDMALSEMQHSQIGSYVEPMIWVYANDIYHFIQPQLWEMYSKVFPTAWAASAFKGAFGENLMIPPIQKHLENNLRWLAVIAKEGGRFSKGIRGIALTGWQRYDHFATLCELLPSAIPSLITSLSTVSKGYFSVDPKDNQIMSLLDCTNLYDGAISRRSGSAWIDLHPNSRHNQLYSLCRYPGHLVYKFMVRLGEKLDEIRLYLANVHTNSAWMSSYNVRHNFSSPLRVRELTVSTQVLAEDISAMAREGYVVMEEAFDEHTIYEFVEQFVFPISKQLQSHINDAERLLQTKIWPRRPLKHSPEMEQLYILPHLDRHQHQ